MIQKQHIIIGLKFKRNIPIKKGGDLIHTITDIHKTFNSENELVKTEICVSTDMGNGILPFNSALRGFKC